MIATRNRFLALVLYAASATGVLLLLTCYASTRTQAQESAGPGAMSRRIGVVKAINGTTIALTPDSGPDVNVTVLPATRIVRIAPGEKDLKNSTPVQLQDIQVGDRILVGGKLSDDKLSLDASTVVVMKKSDLQARDQQVLQDWQKRGVDGIASAVDAGAGTITITSRGKSIVIHTSGATVFRRYPPDSVKFEDAKPSTLKEVHGGDQVRARGDRSADGNDLTAEEIVSGTFRNFAGTINSVDASSSTLSVHDLLSNKNVTIKVTADSQLRKLPLEMAQMMAKRLKGAASGAMPGASPTSGSSMSDQNARPAGAPGAPGGNGPRSGGPPDLQRLISHAPATSLADLHKGDAVVILSTEGATGAGTAITLVSGVEPILQAAPNAGQAMMLAPWSLGAPSGDAGGP
jgi:co-chaperonin GroES (HSP10)